MAALAEGHSAVALRAIRIWVLCRPLLSWV